MTVAVVAGAWRRHQCDQLQPADLVAIPRGSARRGRLSMDLHFGPRGTCDGEIIRGDEHGQGDMPVPGGHTE